MLSTDTRLKVEFLCSRIERGEPVSFSDMSWLQKWAKANRTVHDMVSHARRRAADPESMDGFMDQMNLGNPDPFSHITGESTIDFFRSPDWLQRD